MIDTLRNLYAYNHWANWRALKAAGEPKSYVLGDALLHCANHASYHRGQVVSLLRQLGATPPATDYIFFLDERAGS